MSYACIRYIFEPFFELCMSVLKLNSCFFIETCFFSNEVQVLREKVLQTKLTEARTSPLGNVFLRDKSGLTSAVGGPQMVV